MAKISFEWEDVWSYYPYAEPKTQKDILEVLAGYLKSVAPSHQVKALQAAPLEVIKKHARFLHPIARKKLGLEDEPNKKTNRSSLWSLLS